MQYSFGKALLDSIEAKDEAALTALLSTTASTEDVEALAIANRTMNALTESRLASLAAKMIVVEGDVALLHTSVTDIIVQPVLRSVAIQLVEDPTIPRVATPEYIRDGRTRTGPFQTEVNNVFAAAVGNQSFAGGALVIGAYLSHYNVAAYGFILRNNMVINLLQKRVVVSYEKFNSMGGHKLKMSIKNKTLNQTMNLEFDISARIASVDDILVSFIPASEISTDTYAFYDADWVFAITEAIVSLFTVAKIEFHIYESGARVSHLLTASLAATGDAPADVAEVGRSIADNVLAAAQSLKGTRLSGLLSTFSNTLNDLTGFDLSGTVDAVRKENSLIGKVAVVLGGVIPLATKVASWLKYLV